MEKYYKRRNLTSYTACDILFKRRKNETKNYLNDGAEWSRLVARWAHNPEVGGSNPPSATNNKPAWYYTKRVLLCSAN